LNTLRIAYGDIAKSQALTDSTEASGYPGTNAVHPHLSRAWRTTSNAAQWIKFDVGVGKTILFDTVVIVGHNFTAAAVVKVQTDDADTWAPPGGVDKNGDPTQAIIFVDLAPLPAVGKRYARIYVDDPTNPAAYIQLGRVILCNRYEGDTIDRGLKVHVEDSTTITRSLTGQVFADLGVTSRVYDMSLGSMKNTTKIALFALLTAVGQWDPVVVFPAEPSVPGGVEGVAPLYATMAKTTMFTEIGGWGWTDDGMQFVEAH
jgi:hypothetical protein